MSEFYIFPKIDLLTFRIPEKKFHSDIHDYDTQKQLNLALHDYIPAWKKL